MYSNCLFFHWLFTTLFYGWGHQSLGNGACPKTELGRNWARIQHPSKGKSRAWTLTHDAQVPLLAPVYAIGPPTDPEAEYPWESQTSTEGKKVQKGLCGLRAREGPVSVRRFSHPCLIQEAVLKYSSFLRLFLKKLLQLLINVLIVGVITDVISNELLAL